MKWWRSLTWKDHLALFMWAIILFFVGTIIYSVVTNHRQENSCESRGGVIIEGATVFDKQLCLDKRVIIKVD